MSDKVVRYQMKYNVDKCKKMYMMANDSHIKLWLLSQAQLSGARPWEKAATSLKPSAQCLVEVKKAKKMKGNIRKTMVSSGKLGIPTDNTCQAGEIL